MVNPFNRFPHESEAIQGRRTVMDTAPQPGGQLQVRPTQLISARVNEPRQWIVTLAQPTKGAGPQPWTSTFDGAAESANYPNINPKLFTAPNMPTADAPGAVTSELQCQLRWGAGGVAFYTLFDYPAAGATFGLTADTMDLNVILRSSTVVYATLDDVPIIGAFMVQGQAADPMPLRWLDVPAIIPHGFSRAWAVKPYARKLHITGVMQSKYAVQWLNTAGDVLSTVFTAANASFGVDYLADVPAQATVVRISNQDAAVDGSVTPEWWMGLV